MKRSPTPSAHIVILPNSAETPFQKTPPEPKPFTKNQSNNTHTLQYCHSSFLAREIRRMIILGMIFLLLISSGNILQSAHVLHQDLKAQTQKILDEVSAPPSEIVNTPEIFQRIHNLVSELPIHHTPSASNDRVVSGFESANSLTQAVQILLETSHDAITHTHLIEAQLPTILSGEQNILGITEQSFSLLHHINADIHEAQKHINHALKTPLPPSIREKTTSLTNLLTQAQSLITTALQHERAIYTLLGKQRATDILVLFQNRNELRATGGFPGSLIRIRIEQGSISKFQFEDIFHYSGQLAKDFPVPPQFADLTGVWTPHDCALHPQFSISAEQCLTLFEHSKMDTPDVMITIHNGVLSDLLSLTGPLPIPDTELILTPENASFIISYLTEAKILGQGGTNTPKKILPQLIPPLMERIQNTSPDKLLSLFLTWRSDKTVQIFSRDPDLQALWNTLGLSGKYIPDDHKTDFTGVTFENISGNKSSAYMHTQLYQTSLVNLKGELFHTLSITRSHQWDTRSEDLFDQLFDQFGSPHMDPQSLQHILGNHRNLAFTTIYTPKGTRIRTAKNTLRSEITRIEGADYTAFQFFFPPVAPKTKENVELSFISPISLSTDQGEIYSFSFLRQSGAQNQTFAHHILPESGISLTAHTATSTIHPDQPKTYLIQKDSSSK